MNGIAKFLTICILLETVVPNFVVVASDRNSTKDIRRECQKFDATVEEIYANEISRYQKENVSANHPFLVLSLSMKYSFMSDDFIKKADTDPICWVQNIEKYLLQKTQEKSAQTFLWEPYILITLRDHPEIGRSSIKGFINKCQNLSSRNCIDFFSFLSPYLNSFVARGAIEETRVIQIFDRLLHEVTPSYHYFWEMPPKIGVFDLDTGIDHPDTPGRIISSHLRVCDWGCKLAYEWFEPKEIHFNMFKFVEANNTERDKIIAQMQKFLTERRKTLAETEALENALRGQYSTRMTVTDFAAKLAAWQEHANDPTGDGALQLLLDILFYQVGRNAETKMDDRDAQMTAYLAGEISKVFAKDGLKIFVDKGKENWRNKSVFFSFLNPLRVQLYQKNIPAEMTRNATMRMLATIYEHKYDTGELFRLPGEPPAPPEKPAPTAAKSKK